MAVIGSKFHLVYQLCKQKAGMIIHTKMNISHFLFQERDNALGSRRDMEREIVLLKERLDANQRALDATKAELDLRENRLTTLDREVSMFEWCTFISVES